MIAEFKIFGWIMGMVAAGILAFVKFLHGTVVKHEMQISVVKNDIERLSALEANVNAALIRLGSMETDVAVIGSEVKNISHNMKKDNESITKSLGRLESVLMRRDVAE